LFYAEVAGGGLVPSFYEFGTAVLRSIYQARISSPPIFDPPQAHFPGSLRFTDAWTAIRAEALAIAGQLETVPKFQELMPEQTAISANDGRDWRMFVLKAYGIEVLPNLAACPVLAGLIRQAPAVTSAALSFLAPHKHIPPHYGPFKGILRFHLMLRMPLDADGKPTAVLKVDGAEYLLADGDCLLWDDTYQHEVCNQSDSVRIALLLDVWRPAMPLDMQVLSRLIVLFVQGAMRYRGVSYNG
jgi:aspartate beta-hydroxylase